MHVVYSGDVILCVVLFCGNCQFVINCIHTCLLSHSTPENGRKSHKNRHQTSSNIPIINISPDPFVKKNKPRMTCWKLYSEIHDDLHDMICFLGKSRDFKVMRSVPNKCINNEWAKTYHQRISSSTFLPRFSLSTLPDHIVHFCRGLSESVRAQTFWWHHDIVDLEFYSPAFRKVTSF